MSIARVLTNTTVVGVWLLVAYACHQRVASRLVMSHVGAAVALAHVGAIVGSSWQEALPHGDQHGMGAPIAGFVAGVVVGALAGLLVGRWAAQNRAAFWAFQGVAALFVGFMPLVRR